MRLNHTKSVAIPALFLALLVLAVSAGVLPVLVLTLYAGASAVTFLVYGWDKSAARKRRGRTRERTLHTLALVGGWPGALVAQRVFRHKTQKQPFRSTFRITVVANCAALAVLLFLTL